MSTKSKRGKQSCVKAYVDPDSVTWKILPCTVRKTCDLYKKAREMLPMAEDTDGLDTEKETGRGKRKKRRRKRRRKITHEFPRERLYPGHQSLIIKRIFKSEIVALYGMLCKD
ncbi:hypothetical protein DBV15_12627 [Temnothorax longispinosus]|uniref:Uncharacterized protein n=1 Tax=Temnothorax longispinosus TaxID=300112 RepID=A0A4S2KS57_9HYME|nr:hypothetical protein DBV15_12627 [Temnothorax longispinosus]